MCRRTQLLCLVLMALGAGLLLSCIVEGWLIRLLLGAALVIAGLLAGKEGC